MKFIFNELFFLFPCISLQIVNSHCFAQSQEVTTSHLEVTAAGTVRTTQFAEEQQKGREGGKAVAESFLKI